MPERDRGAIALNVRAPSGWVGEIRDSAMGGVGDSAGTSETITWCSVVHAAPPSDASHIAGPQVTVTVSELAAGWEGFKSWAPINPLLRTLNESTHWRSERQQDRALRRAFTRLSWKSTTIKVDGADVGFEVASIGAGWLAVRQVGQQGVAVDSDRFPFTGVELETVELST